MQEYPQYSVLMSVYEKENPIWFKRSIDSMLKQTVKPSEFVIVVDGPIPKDLEKIVKCCERKRSDLFRIVRLERNSGLGIALKIGLNECKYEYIARMDSDDYSRPDRIEKELMEFERHPELDMVGTNVIEFYGKPENKISKVILPENNDEIIEFSKKRNPYRHPSMLLKKKAVLRAGNYRDYYLFEDYDMWLRMIRSGCNGYNIQECLTYMRIGKDFYRRRGGIKYLRSIYRFKKEQYDVGYISFYGFLKSFVPHAVVCLLPNGMRDYIYRNFLREKSK